MLRRIKNSFLFVFLFFSSAGYGQERVHEVDVRKSNEYRIVSYNVENLFDIYDDSLKRDGEFTPDGMKHWDNRKFYKKLNDIYVVIAATGGWSIPEYVGLSEVENRFVLDKLLEETPLSTAGYEIVHSESPDRRGIDVAALYRKDKMTLLGYETLPIIFPYDTTRRTRDVLVSTFQLKNGSVIHIYQCHWPSKWGGVLKTNPARAYVGQVIKQHSDSIINSEPKANIIVTGDLNDTPTDESVYQHLGAVYEEGKEGNLYNVSYNMSETKGTHKYRNEWSVIDHIIVSPALKKGQGGIELNSPKSHVFVDDFLLEEDDRYMGMKPFRTYLGMRYHGGYSDHLPVYIDITSTKP